ncbi:protein PAL OF QUIRKY-like [Phragmites australis]|uniref:protein PAL OF QUIRKY-like n=1 Tax=Phragmites australis TaxID=29695 RepID=UPI002D77227D|nr:protein PAL OF QUIRKY-like [Phragmites australis]
MAAEASGASAVDGRMRLLCSHSGRLVPCGPDGALRYVGGETRVLFVPRAVPFRDLAEMAGGAEVRAVRHRLADDEDVLVSVTCDEELAHMRDEYDRLRATRPTAGFRVFVITTTSAVSGGGGGAPRRRTSSGLPPLAPKMWRVQSEQTLTARAQLHRGTACPAPMRRV